MTAGCLDESTVLAFLAGTLPSEARPAVEQHIDACSACADLVTWAAADQASATRPPGHEGPPFIGQLQPGTRVGRYQILGAIGRGGMGEVYAAYHPDLDRRIAVKIVKSGDDRTDDRRTRLLGEARAVARLSHPNVITVYDAGWFGERVYIAMELIDGWTIERWLRAERPGWRAILDVFVAAGRGLAAAHAAGIIHRDFKPQNVMIGRDGTVRVMDFGLARMTGDDAADGSPASAGEPARQSGAQAEPDALVGTPAYMAPEQFRREITDERSDQFSFCVVMHEALLGSRPAGTSDVGAGKQAPAPPRRAAVPGWLRAVVLRGASIDRARRYPSMNDLLAALERGRTRLRQRASLAGVALAMIGVGIGGWRAARSNQIACVVPTERLAAAWSVGDAENPRRQAVHRALAATGRATAETSWERLSKVLDDYVTAWGAMYVQTCEATHVRGEQSAEILDRRMFCLNDSLDQVRALSETLATADASALSQAVAAAQNLTPISRCGDIQLLRSAVSLPHDQRVLVEVQRLRASLAEVEALHVLGRFPEALKKALALRPAAEATGYKPLIAETLYDIGQIRVESSPAESEEILEQAAFTAAAGGDDEMAAEASASLAFALGYHLGRPKDGLRWASFAHAFLDRLGAGHQRTRGWVVGTEATINWSEGNFEASRRFAIRSIDLLTVAVGKEHPEVGVALSNLSFPLLAMNRFEQALAAAERAVQILRDHSDPNSFYLSSALYNRGEALRRLGRREDARASFVASLKIAESAGNGKEALLAEPLSGLGAIALDEEKPATAVPMLERALAVRGPGSAQEVLVADTQFALARALWGAGGDRRRARSLATAARDVYGRHNHLERRQVAEAWLHDHLTAV